MSGKVVELVYTGSAHAPDMTALYFPSERLLFAVDGPAVTRIPFTFQGFTPRQVRDWVRAVVALDFDTLVTGRGERVAKADIVAFNQYLDALIDGVQSGFEMGPNC
jgi:glyoxylase-like metal-dependent hydrolase (beta-lactamase superfamily II)